MKIIQKKTQDLIPYINNARTHTEDQIAKIAASIKEFGFTNPVLIDSGNGIIAGHGRVSAAVLLGMESLPTIELAHLSNAQLKAYILADNRLAELAGWDDGLLANELDELKAMDFDIDLIGFDDFDFEDETTEGLTDTDEVPEPPADPVSKFGDVWLLGKHRVMCSDATSIEAVNLLMNGQKADMIFTDPPYGVSIGDKNKMLNTFQKSGRCLDNIKNDGLSPDDLYVILIAVFKNAKLILNDCCAVYVTSPQGGGLCMMMLKMMKDAGLEVRHILNWVKNSPTFSMGRLDYEYQHEPILFT